MTPQHRTLIRTAARNNALWCAAMSGTHGVSGEVGDEAWTAPARTPLYYPDAVTLVPGADADALVARIDTAAPGATVKDSFGDLDLTGAGFQILFEATWIHRPADAPAPAGTPSWTVVEDADSLRAWAEAWDDGDGAADLFGPRLLDEKQVFVIATHDGAGRITAGAVLNRDAGAVGVSNVFAHDAPADTAWRVALDAAHHLAPGLPVVGYEHGDDLAAALRHGCEPIGELRVWLRP
ncbi:hypothetical protein [Streptomyces sp. VRA16 Mangrove soil]|uniref:hypothetical protein n=1 Tax=Streptomyces sp. VRA16 Mangrove soil TaxID=2817434 RepID=UPI001A9F9061|nr:hypothetical protein [Streptomyces sp. VRA16 Mangrove soil]MBO1330660.1 hypothetical protein [Streptomyces sp. VRA16 Mangrove soil]